MNTRLQVEHPVTEAVTGLDLVRLQIGIAEGKPLPFAQEDIAPRGHALECRLYAEDPAHDDLPSPGGVLLAAFPQGPGVRCDAGIETGSNVSVHYDPLLAKIVTWGADRTEAIERMSAALADTAVLGVTTNIARLRQIVANDAFRAGAIHTGFVDQVLGALPAAAWPPDEALAAAVAALAVAANPPRRGGRAAVSDPWSKPDGFRVGP
jgi:acetyl/propionyl-CoA carboxylase alpha subunit